MKELRVENYALESFREEEESDTLSFCDLEENYSGSIEQTPKTPSDHLFDFLISQSKPVARSNPNNIIFCGKIIHEEEEEEDQLNEYQKRDYFATVKSQSFRRSSFSDHDSDDNRRISSSSADRFSADLTRSKCSSNTDYHVQSVNITSLTSMSAKSRRRMFMFGPVKFKPEMELSAIKQRQARGSPVEKVAENGGMVLRSSLRGRSHLTSVLARSLGCITAADGGAGRLAGVAN